MNKDLQTAMQILRPAVYVVSEEEDRVVNDINATFGKDSDIFVYRTTIGLLSYSEYRNEVNNKASKGKNKMFLDTLNEIHKASPTERASIYVLFDVDNYFSGKSEGSINAIRKVKDIILQISKDDITLKQVVIVSSNLTLPKNLERYIEVFYYDLPSEEEIEAKVKEIVKSYSKAMGSAPSSVDGTVIRNLKGLTDFEIEQVCLLSLKQHSRIAQESVIAHKRSALRKTDLISLIDTDITLDDVGGMSKLKHWLNVRSGAWTDDGAKFGVPLLKGAMLIGITGCGKTLISKAIASLWGLPLVQFSPSRLMSAKVGTSESNMMKALKIVEAISPCVVFIDEIEKQFAGSHSSSVSDAGTTSRVIGTFLTWYQDTQAPIFLVSTCNSVEFIPPELISRFDEKFFVNIPTLEERKQIFEIQLRKWNVESGPMNVDELSRASIQLTGREIEQVVKSAIHEAYYEAKTAGKKPKLEQEHLLRVLKSKVPIVKTMDEEIKYLVQWVGWDEERKQGIRASWANDRQDSDIDTMLAEILASDDVVSNRRNRNN